MSIVSHKYFLMNDDLIFPRSEDQDKKRVDYFYLIKSLASICLCYLSFVIIKILMLKSSSLGISTINFYRGLVFIFSSVGNIVKNKIDLNQKENFNKENFYSIVKLGLVEGSIYAFTFLVVNYFDLLTFSYLIFIYVAIKVIFLKNFYNYKITKYDTLSVCSLLFFLALNFILDKENDFSNVKGVFFYLTIPFLINGRNTIHEKINHETNINVRLIANGLCTLVFTPLLTCLESRQNLLSLKFTILSIIIGFCLYLNEIILDSILTKFKSDNNYFNYLYSSYLFSFIIIINFFILPLNIYSILIGIAMIFSHVKFQ